MKVVRRTVRLPLFPLFVCRFSRRASNPLVHLTTLALMFCACVFAVHAQEARVRVMSHHVRPEVTSHLAAFMGGSLTISRCSYPWYCLYAIRLR